MNCNYSRESLKGAKHTFGGYHTFSTPCSNKDLRVQCSIVAQNRRNLSFRELSDGVRLNCAKQKHDPCIKRGVETLLASEVGTQNSFLSCHLYKAPVI